jgi:hypothetical protein
MPITPALKRVRYQDVKYQNSLGYKVKLSFDTKIIFKYELIKC